MQEKITFHPFNEILDVEYRVHQIIKILIILSRTLEKHFEESVLCGVREGISSYILADDAVELVGFRAEHDVPHVQPEPEGRQGARAQGGTARDALPRRPVPVAHHEHHRGRQARHLGHV